MTDEELDRMDAQLACGWITAPESRALLNEVRRLREAIIEGASREVKSVALGHREKCPAYQSVWKTADYPNGSPPCHCGVA